MSKPEDCDDSLSAMLHHINSLKMDPIGAHTEATIFFVKKLSGVCVRLALNIIYFIIL